MLGNDSTPIPPSAERARDHIRAAAGGYGPDNEIERSRALAVLTEEGLSRSEAQEQVEVLLERGYLYAVGEMIRVTPDD